MFLFRDMLKSIHSTRNHLSLINLRYSRFWKFVSKYYDFADLSKMTKYTIDNPVIYLYPNRSRRNPVDNLYYQYKNLKLLAISHTDFMVYWLGDVSNIKMNRAPDAITAFYDNSVVIKYNCAMNFDCASLNKRMVIYE